MFYFIFIIFYIFLLCIGLLIVQYDKYKYILIYSHQSNILKYRIRNRLSILYTAENNTAEMNAKENNL